MWRQRAAGLGQEQDDWSGDDSGLDGDRGYEGMRRGGLEPILQEGAHRL